MVLVVIGTARRSPRRWPLWTAVIGAVLTVLGSFVYPVVVEPLFNSFTSLPAGPLRTRDPAAGAHRGGAGPRRAGRRRLPSYDDPERLRLGVRQHPARGPLRQPGQRRAAAGGALGRGPRARARQAPRRGHRHGPGRRGRGAGGRSAGAAAHPPPAARPRRAPRGRDHPRWWRCSWRWPPWARCWPARSRTPRAGPSRRAPTGRRSRRPTTTRRSRPCSSSSPCSSLSDPEPPALSQFWFGSHPTALQRIGIADALQRMATRGR